MRTTLTLDDDLAALLKQRAQQLGIPFKDMVNRALRAALGAEASSPRGPAPVTEPHAFGLHPGIDPDKLGQLDDDLFAEELVERARGRAR